MCKNRQVPFSTKLPSSTMDLLEKVAAITGDHKNGIVNTALLRYLPGIIASAQQPGSLFTEGADDE